MSQKDIHKEKLKYEKTEKEKIHSKSERHRKSKEATKSEAISQPNNNSICDPVMLLITGWMVLHDAEATGNSTAACGDSP